jgi:hypothetical protein
VASAHIKLIEEKLAKASEMIAAAQAEYAEALEMAEDNDEISAATGIKNLQKTAGKLARATEMEMLLMKHSDHAPRTAELVRGIN